jgi:hypothetical protein
MSARHILKLAILFKNAVFDHRPEDMCCGGTMVRKDCPYHKDEVKQGHIHHMIFRETSINGISGSVRSSSGNLPKIKDRVSISHIPGKIGEEITATGDVFDIEERGDHTLIGITFDSYIRIAGTGSTAHRFLWYPV